MMPSSLLKNLYRFLHPRYQTLFLEYPVQFKPRYGHGLPPHKELYQLIDQRRDVYRDLLGKALSLKEKLWTIQGAGRETDPVQPAWNNGFLPGLDIVGIYTMLSVYKPKRYIEVGSGNSTKVAYKAKQDGQLDVRIISIDPMPRAEIDRLADEVIRKPFESIDLKIVDQLEANDILFIDNSHRILPNSDSMVFYMEILPRLKPGVIVHIHDVYLPYDYPQFMCDRFYSEQYGLAFFLLANPSKYQTLLPNYFISEDPELRDLFSPFWQHPNLANVEQHGGSFWLVVGQ